MDEKKYKESVKNHLDKLLRNAKTPEKIGYAMRFVDYYEEDLDVSKYRSKLQEKINMLSMFNYN